MRRVFQTELCGTNLGQGGLQLPHVIPHCAGGDTATDMDGVGQVLHKVNNIDSD